MVNRRFPQQENLTENALLGRPYDSVSLWLQNSGDPCPVESVLVTGEMVARTDRLLVNGRPQWLERSVFPVFDSGGRVEYAVETVRDVTSQKVLEQERMEREKLTGPRQ